jgi:hypothetical protein
VKARQRWLEMTAEPQPKLVCTRQQINRTIPVP